MEAQVECQCSVWAVVPHGGGDIFQQQQEEIQNYYKHNSLMLILEHFVCQSITF